MAERYTRLFALSGKLYTPGAPVIIEAGALLKDNQLNRVLAQIKLKSISPKEIKAVKVRILPLDVTGVALGQAVDHAYLDLEVCRDDSFGQQSPVVMKNADTRGFTVTVIEVVFADNTLWNGSSAWNILAEPTSVESVYPDGIIQDQFHIEMGQVRACMPTDTQDLWYCVCGAINHQGEQTCHVCGRNHRELAALVSSLTEEKLQAAYDAQQEQEAQERAAAQAEAERKAAIAKAEAEKSRKKNQKITAIVAAIAVIVVAGYLATVNFVIPHVNNQRAYTSAEALLNEGNYEEAIEAFTALGDYKDSVQRIAETNELLNEATERELAAQYAEAETLLDAGKYDDAVEAFEALGDYSDAKNMVIYCRNEQLYSEITELLSNGNTANAYLLLQELGEYKDSTEMMENLVFENPYLEYLAVQERETVFFGAYEQDNDTSNGAEPVEWIVLKKRENQLMLLSKYCLDAQPFDTTDANYMVWQNSELYDWLNTEFLEAAFSEDERNMIMDKITLLGVDDTETYIDQIGTLSAEATSYAIAQGADTRDGNAYWWLKTFFDPFTGNYGTYGSSAAYVTPSGTVSSTALDISDISIRPVVWIEIT